jgi:aarF domain-containing kinase
MFAQIAQPVHVPPIGEVEKQFMTEFDYRRKAERMESKQS